MFPIFIPVDTNRPLPEYRKGGWPYLVLAAAFLAGWFGFGGYLIGLATGVDLLAGEEFPPLWETMLIMCGWIAGLLVGPMIIARRAFK